MKKILYILFILVPSFIFAQEFNFVFEPDSIPVEVEGWNPYCPWAGGMSQSNSSVVDIDGDGDLDYFIGEYSGYIKYFRNEGTSTEPSFTYPSAQFDSLYMEEAVANQCFIDIDNDNDYDIVVSDNDPHVHLYRNIGTSQNPDFFHETSTLVPYQSPWCRGPELADIDGDTDYDLFGGNHGQISFFRNIGFSDSFYFELESGTFSGIDVGDRASPEFIDIDADNDLDLFIGNELGYIWYYRNDGDSVNYNFTYVTNYYDSIDVGSYASPEFADIDGDGDFDMFVGSGGGFIYFYENVGLPNDPDFQFITWYYLNFEPGWKVQVVDINGDNAPDLIDGAGYYMTYTENVGTADEPSYLFMDYYFQDIMRSAIKPCFVDLDDDGDYDLLAGEGVIPGPPTIAYYTNDGTPRSPDFRLVNENYITNQNFFVNACPSVADIDADGDYDLFITTDDDYLFYYENTGTPLQPNFVLVDSQWQDILYPMWRGMAFGDIDADGDLDLLIQNDWQMNDFGNIRYYRNEGTPQVPNMVYVTNEFLPAVELYGAFPYLVDIDLDSDLDLFVGDQYYGTSFFRNWGLNSVNGEPGNQPFTFTLYQNYPNPFNASTVISFELRDAGFVSLDIFNITGRAVGAQNFVPLQNQWMSGGNHQVVWDASGVSSGVYLVKLGSGDEVYGVKKLVLIK